MPRLAPEDAGQPQMPHCAGILQGQAQHWPSRGAGQRPHGPAHANPAAPGARTGQDPRRPQALRASARPAGRCSRAVAGGEAVMPAAWQALFRPEPAGRQGPQCARARLNEKKGVTNPTLTRRPSICTSKCSVSHRAQPWSPITRRRLRLLMRLDCYRTCLPAVLLASCTAEA